MAFILDARPSLLGTLVRAALAIDHKKGHAIPMWPSLDTFRFVMTLFIASMGGTSAISTTQGSDLSRDTAQNQPSAIPTIDPTTGGPSLVIDPSSSQPYENLAVNTSEPGDPAAAVQDGEAAIGSDPDTIQSANTKAAASEEFVLKSILTIPEGPFRYGDWHWNETKAPKDGPLVVTVDLDARVVSAFRDGHEIGTAVALLGTKKHPTPLGTFPILSKEKDNISEKYNNTPMPWTLRLTWDGIAIHGSPVINGYASHGCIGVPDGFAEKLFAVAKRGDRVVITRGEMMALGDSF